jgi:hypothetical protein
VWIARRDPVLRGLILGAVLFSILVRRFRSWRRRSLAGT